MKAEFKSETITVDEVKHGDTLLIDGRQYSISREDIKRCPFMGVTIMGRRMTECVRVLFPKWYRGQIIRYQAQI